MPKPGNARERHELRRNSFSANAALYHKARPSYPEQLFDDLVRLSGITSAGRILEIGSGTGLATLPLARRGYTILCLEPGQGMARLCRSNLTAWPGVAVRTTRFEDWPVELQSFDLVLSASAFHWVRPGIGYSHAAAALKPRGHIALIWLFREDQLDPLSLDLHQTYESLGLKPWRPRPPEARIERQRRAIERSGRFGPVTVLRYPGSHDYSADTYIALLRTMSDHAILPPATRRRLWSRIRSIFTRRGGTFTRRFIAALLLAPKR